MRYPDRPACSESLYLLSYRGPNLAASCSFISFFLWKYNFLFTPLLLTPTFSGRQLGRKIRHWCKEIDKKKGLEMKEEQRNKYGINDISCIYILSPFHESLNLIKDSIRRNSFCIPYESVWESGGVNPFILNLGNG